MHTYFRSSALMMRKRAEIFETKNMVVKPRKWNIGKYKKVLYTIVRLIFGGNWDVNSMKCVILIEHERCIHYTVLFIPTMLFFFSLERRG